MILLWKDMISTSRPIKILQACCRRQSKGHAIDVQDDEMTKKLQVWWKLLSNTGDISDCKENVANNKGRYGGDGVQTKSQTKMVSHRLSWLSETKMIGVCGTKGHCSLTSITSSTDNDDIDVELHQGQQMCINSVEILMVCVELTWMIITFGLPWLVWNFKGNMDSSSRMWDSIEQWKIVHQFKPS